MLFTELNLVTVVLKTIFVFSLARRFTKSSLDSSSISLYPLFLPYRFFPSLDRLPILSSSSTSTRPRENSPLVTIRKRQPLFLDLNSPFKHRYRRCLDSRLPALSSIDFLSPWLVHSEVKEVVRTSNHAQFRPRWIFKVSKSSLLFCDWTCTGMGGDSEEGD